MILHIRYFFLKLDLDTFICNVSPQLLAFFTAETFSLCKVLSDVSQGLCLPHANVSMLVVKPLTKKTENHLMSGTTSLCYHYRDVSV